jgi:integrase
VGRAERPKTTVGDLGAQLLATKGDRNTAAWNRAMLLHVNRTWQHTLIPSVDHLGVQGWVHKLELEGHGPDTVRGAFRLLHEIVAMALRARIVHHDPCLGVTLPKVNRREMLFLTAQQIETLGSSLEDRWPGFGWGTLMRFAAFTGCRAGEVAGLRVRHLDLLRRRAHVVESRKTYGEDGAPKTGKSRWVDLPRQLCDELAAHLAER